MGGSLLALLDDIAAVLDDVALMTKVAAQKTAGVLGDDLALNAEQVSGVRAERELPVVWNVAKGSAINKLILVPAALLISAFIPQLITPLLMVGGAYLCYEGSEKIVHKFFHKDAKKTDKNNPAPTDEITDIEAFEKTKIKGAIRTDFVLSAEIIVIALGSMAQGTSIWVQVAVLSLIAAIMTVGVYGLVAGIVKLDDIGFYMMRKTQRTTLKYRVGQLLVNSAPKLMRLLAVVGTIAMFTVGGGILVHGIAYLHIVTDFLAQQPLGSLVNILFNALFGIIAGVLCLIIKLGIFSIKQLGRN